MLFFTLKSYVRVWWLCINIFFIRNIKFYGGWVVTPFARCTWTAFVCQKNLILPSIYNVYSRRHLLIFSLYWIHCTYQTQRQKKNQCIASSYITASRRSFLHISATGFMWILKKIHFPQTYSQSFLLFNVCNSLYTLTSLGYTVYRSDDVSISFEQLISDFDKQRIDARFFCSFAYQHNQNKTLPLI